MIALFYTPYNYTFCRVGVIVNTILSLSQKDVFFEDEEQYFYTSHQYWQQYLLK